MLLLLLLLLLLLFDLSRSRSFSAQVVFVHMLGAKSSQLGWLLDIIGLLSEVESPAAPARVCLELPVDPPA